MAQTTVQMYINKKISYTTIEIDIIYVEPQRADDFKQNKGSLQMIGLSTVLHYLSRSFSLLFNNIVTPTTPT